MLTSIVQYTYYVYFMFTGRTEGAGEGLDM